MRRSFVVLVCGCALLLAMAIGAFYSDDISRLWSSYLISIQIAQQGLQALLVGMLRNIEAEPFNASLSLISFSFLYGVFHAAGPGHGKVVISTYLLSQKTQLRRGIILSVSSALVQGISAIILVTAATWLFNLSMRKAQLIVGDIELASFALVSLAGLFIVLWRARHIVRLFYRRGDTEEGQHHHHDEACGHAHHPTGKALETDVSILSFLGIIASVGIRPCSGAVIVLLLANSLNLKIAGLLSVLSMSIGTALTVSIIAVIAVYARAFATRLLGVMPERHVRMSLAANMVGMAGGLVILMFGLSLFSAAYFAPAHPFR